MDPKPAKTPFFLGPFAAWTELAFKLWGFGQAAAPEAAPQKALAVAVIPTADAPVPQPAAKRPPRARKAAGSASKAKRVKARGKTKATVKRAAR